LINEKDDADFYHIISVLSMFPYLAPTPPAMSRLFETQSILHIVFGIGSATLEHPWLTLRWVLAMLWCLFIVYNIVFHYYMAVREPPGSVVNGLGDGLGERRIGPGSDAWWSRHRDRACKESILSTRNERKLPLLHLDKKGEHFDADEILSIEEGEDLWVNVKMCHKCPRIPLYKAIACLPPELRKVEMLIRRRKMEEAKGIVNGVHTPDGEDVSTKGDTIEEIKAWLGNESDTLVPPPKPERTHHCSVCDTCILKFDHHCPWLNQCVGIGNERYFVLFMVWLTIGCMVVMISGWRVVAQTLSFKPWPYNYVPRIFPLLTYAICALMGIGVGVMSVWQVLIVGWGETSVESSDNTHYREVCRRKGVGFTNVYDIGFTQNLCLFFNVGTLSSHSIWVAMAPWRIEPYSDGWHYSKRLGIQGRHVGLEPEEELTDDEIERDDAHPMAK
jgi:hypothetical protein